MELHTKYGVCFRFGPDPEKLGLTDNLDVFIPEEIVHNEYIPNEKNTIIKDYEIFFQKIKHLNDSIPYYPNDIFYSQYIIGSLRCFNELSSDIRTFEKNIVEAFQKDGVVFPSFLTSIQRTSNYIFSRFQDFPLSYPNSIQNRFFWQTSGFLYPGNDLFSSKMIPSDKLDTLIQDFSPFNHFIHKKHIASAPPSMEDLPSYIDYYFSGEDAITFLNLDKSCRLVVPPPIKKGSSFLDFTTIKDYIDNCPIQIQKQFWKNVYFILFLYSREYPGKRIYVSTHGLGVPYFHLRLEPIQPKYYKP